MTSYVIRDIIMKREHKFSSDDSSWYGLVVTLLIGVEPVRIGVPNMYSDTLDLG